MFLIWCITHCYILYKHIPWIFAAITAFTISRCPMWSYFQKLWVLGHPAAWTPTSDQQYSDLVTCSDKTAITVNGALYYFYSFSIQQQRKLGSSECFFFSNSKPQVIVFRSALVMGLMAVIFWAFCNITEKLHGFDGYGNGVCARDCLSLKYSWCQLSGTQPRQTGSFITLSCEHLPYGCVAKCVCVLEQTFSIAFLWKPQLPPWLKPTNMQMHDSLENYWVWKSHFELKSLLF